VSFTRLFDTKFGRTIPKRVLQLIERDNEAALAAANGGVALPKVKQFNKTRPSDPVLPAVSAYKRRVREINQPEGQRVESVAEFAVEFAVEAQTEDEAQERIEIYVEAGDSILRADPDYLLQDLPEGIRGLVELEITEHVYSRPVPDGKRSVAAAAITLTARMFEP
jgi:hypothetical protein